MRCPDCNKFVSYDESAEPEAMLEVETDGTDEATVSGTVRVVLTCAECGTELKETSFDVDETVEVPEAHTCHIAEVVGCAPHVLGTACAVCGWNGEPKTMRLYTETIERFDPPQEMFGERVIGKIGGGGSLAIFNEAEREEFERRAAEAERKNSGIPAERKGRAAYDEEASFEAMVHTAELTSRSDCGVNKRTGKPNKFNPRFATKYYGFALEGEVQCSCGEVKVPFKMTDEIMAAGMDEMV